MTKVIVSAALFSIMVLSAAGSSAYAATLAHASVLKPNPQSNQIVQVHGDWDDDDDDDRRHWRRHHRGHHVDAPFAHVETGRRVVVDAPFAHVYVGRNGRRIVAPFVDLWVPRRRH